MSFCTKPAVLNLVMLLCTNLTAQVHAVTTSWNTNSSGSFTTAANWDNGVPDSEDIAVFNRGTGVAYTVTIPGGSVLDPPPSYLINYLRVLTNEVTFADNSSPFVTSPSLTVFNPDVSIIVGENVGEQAVLTTSLSSFSSANTSIGRQGAHGTLNVNAGTFNASGEIVVGDRGFGTLNVTGSGVVQSQRGVIGKFFGGNGLAIVSGTNARWINSSDLTVGAGGSGRLQITGGRVDSVHGSTEGAASVTVDGANSQWVMSGDLTVAKSGGGNLTISNGGSVQNQNAFIGAFPGSSGTVTVTGTGSTWTSDGWGFGLGGTSALDSGYGTLTVENGGTVNINGSSWVFIGAYLDSGDGTLTVESGGTMNIASPVYIRAAGTVNLNGGQINLPVLEFQGGTFNFAQGTLNFTTSQSITAGGDIEWALGGERRVRLGQHLGVQGIATLNAPFQIDGGGLEVDSLVVNSDLLFSAGLLEVRGGAITGLTSLVVPANGEFRSKGVHSFRVTSAAGSTIKALANFTIGDATKVNGFYSNGTLDIGANMVTLSDANDAVFDSAALITLGNAGSSGTLSAANGMTLDIGGNITGYGTISTPNDLSRRLTNNGHITGNSGAQPITLTGYVKGAGTFDHVTFTGTFDPDLSPKLMTAGSLGFGPTSTLIMEVGGTTRGSQYDAILASGNLAFDGTLQVTLTNGFSPQAGNSFDLFDAASITGEFDTLDLPALNGGLTWNTSQLYTLGLLSISSSLLADYNQNGIVDAADYVVWRKSPSNFGGNPGGYNIWRANFGQTSNSGAAAIENSVPEPGSLVPLALIAATLLRRHLSC